LVSSKCRVHSRRSVGLSDTVFFVFSSIPNKAEEKRNQRTWTFEQRRHYLFGFEEGGRCEARSYVRVRCQVGFIWTTIKRMNNNLKWQIAPELVWYQTPRHRRWV
jgi:hypothetical protein